MKAIIVVVCITVAVLQSLEGVVVAKDKHKAKDNADNSIGNMKARFRNIVIDDEKPEENDQSSSKLGSRDTTGVRILYPFRIILSTLGEVSNALSTLVHTLVTVFDYCLRIPATVVKVLLCAFIDATLYLLLDIILKVVVNRGLIIIIWIPHGLFDFMLNTMPLEDIITKYVSTAYFILHEVVLKITIVCYWLSVFIVITSLTCYILHQARIITLQQLPTGRQAISTILRTMTLHNLKLWIKDITTMQYTFIILLTSFISFHSFYTFIPACNYILRNLVLKTVPVIYWVLVVIVTSYMLCKMGVLLYKQKHVVLNPVSLRLSPLWNFVCTNKAMTWILHRVIDWPVCHVVYNAIHACFKSVVGHKSIRRALSIIHQICLSIRSNVLSIFHEMKVFVPWFPAIEDRINSLALENARRTSTRTDNTSDSYEGIRKENVAIHKRYDKEKIEVLHSRNRPRIIDSNNIKKKKTPVEAGNWFTKDSCMFETKSNLKDENTKGEEKSFDNVIDADDDGVEEFQDTQETFKEADTEEVPFGNIQIIMSSLDTDFDKAKPADRKFMGNVYIHDEVEDKPLWDVKGIRE